MRNRRINRLEKMEEDKKKAKGPSKPPKRRPRKPGTNKPGRPKAGVDGLPSNLDKCVWYKIHEPKMSPPEIAAKLGIGESQVEKYLASAEGKRRLKAATQKATISWPTITRTSTPRWSSWPSGASPFVLRAPRIRSATYSSA